MLGYFRNNKLLCMDQFGFRPGHSTELAALRLVDHLITQMDKCRVPTNIYSDLSKAFDTLNHDILLQKLKYYGITGTSVNFLQSYLSERYQYVEYNGHRSNTYRYQAVCHKAQFWVRCCSVFILMIYRW